MTGHVYTSEGVFWQVMIHLAFIVSALALAWIDKMSMSHQQFLAAAKRGKNKSVAAPAE